MIYDVFLSKKPPLNNVETIRIISTNKIYRKHAG